MGQFISTSGIQSTHDVNGYPLTFQINGPIQECVNDKEIDVFVKGFLYLKGEQVSDVSNSIKDEFKEFVKSDTFKDYVSQSLFVKDTTFPDSFPYNVPEHTINDVTWSLSVDPAIEYNEKDKFTLKLRFGINSSTKKKSTLRGVVIMIGKGLISALEEKRTESMPILDAEGNSYEFGPKEIVFETK